MKQITATTWPYSFGGKEFEMTTKELIESIVNSVPKDGLNPGQMKERIEFLSVLETQSIERGFFEFNDDNLQRLKMWSKEMKFVTVSKGIVDFYDELNAM